MRTSWLFIKRYDIHELFNTPLNRVLQFYSTAFTLLESILKQKTNQEYIPYGSIAYLQTAMQRYTYMYKHSYKITGTDFQNLYELLESRTLSRGIVVSRKVNPIMFQLQHGKEHESKCIKTDIPNFFQHFLRDHRLTHAMNDWSPACVTVTRIA